MDDYDVPDGKDPYIVGWLVGGLSRKAQGRGVVADWAQNELDGLVQVGYLTPKVWWAVRDTSDGSFAAADLPSKRAALAKRRELGGNSARYRVEPIHPVASPEQP